MSTICTPPSRLPSLPCSSVQSFSPFLRLLQQIKKNKQIIKKLPPPPPKNQVINNLPRESKPDVVIDTHGVSASFDNAEIHTKAVGVTFDDCQDNIAASDIGDKLIIKHAPVDKYIESTDIINARTNKRIGRIKKELAFELLDQFGKGFSLDGEITDITGGTPDAPTYGCNIIIYKF